MTNGLTRRLIDAVKGATVTKAANAAQGTKDVVKGVVLPPTRHQGDRGEYGEGYADDDSHPTPDFAWEGGQDVNLRESVLQEMNQHAMSTFSKRMRGAMRGASLSTTEVSGRDCARCVGLMITRGPIAWA